MTAGQDDPGGLWGPHRQAGQSTPAGPGESGGLAAQLGETQQEEQQPEGNGQAGPAAQLAAAPCCGWECAGKPGKPFTPHWFAVHGKDGQLGLKGTCRRLPSSDLASARMVREMYAGDGHPVRWGKQTDRWRQWDGTRYAPQDVTFATGMAEWYADAYKKLLRDVDKRIEIEVARDNPGLGEDARSKKVAKQQEFWKGHRKHLGRLWSENGQAALIRQLGRTCVVDDSQLDVGTGEIIVDGGRISWEQIRASYRKAAPGQAEVMPTVQPLNHDPARLVTKRMGKGVDYDSAAQCPAFDQFMETSVADWGQREWLLWRAACALFGRMPRKGFVNDIGPTDSGKSTFALIMHDLGGDYVITVPVRTFLAKPASDQNFLAASLRGARMVLAAEPRPGGRYDDGYMKDITGREPQRTADKNEKHINWMPQCTPFISSNAPIRFATSDQAMMKRQEVVRFGAGYEQMDEGLLERMRGELPGILNRLLGQLLREAQHGQPPLFDSMIAAREQLADETENALAFVAGLIEAGQLAGVPGAVLSHCVQLTPLFRAYRDWAEDEEKVPLPQRLNRTTFREVVGRRYPVDKSNGYRFTGLVAGSGLYGERGDIHKTWKGQ